MLDFPSFQLSGSHREIDRHLPGEQVIDRLLAKGFLEGPAYRVPLGPCAARGHCLLEQVIEDIQGRSHAIRVCPVQA